MSKPIVKVFFDVETTGTNVKRHSIHQIAGLIEVGGVIKERFNIKSRPHPKAEIAPEALAVCNITEAELMAYQTMKEAYYELTEILGKYIDKYNRKEKAYLVGFNNRAFDDIFLRAWFVQNGDSYFGSWFWTDSLDVLVLASQYLIGPRRAAMPSFKLGRVAKELGLGVDNKKLHDAFYDVELTYEIYLIVVGLEIE